MTSSLCALANLAGGGLMILGLDERLNFAPRLVTAHPADHQSLIGSWVYCYSVPRPPVGPRRSDSERSYLAETRIVGILAAAAVIAGVASDFLSDFWTTHALTAGLAASVVVIMLSAGIFNEVVDRRRRRRWSVLAQHVMFELASNARMFWTGMLEIVGDLPADVPTKPNDFDGPNLVEPERLAPALSTLLADPTRRQQLQQTMADLVPHNDELLSRWAGVMLTADVYAEIMDRHVEFAENVVWVSSVLDLANPPDDAKRRRQARASAAARLQGIAGDEVIIQLLTRIVQLAEQLDRNTFDLARALVPIEWWQARLKADIPILVTDGQSGTR